MKKKKSASKIQKRNSIFPNNNLWNYKINFPCLKESIQNSKKKYHKIIYMLMKIIQIPKIIAKLKELATIRKISLIKTI